MVEGDNGKSRMAALLRLVEWHTPDGQVAVQALRFDCDSHLVRAAEKALEAFAGDWKGLSDRLSEQAQELRRVADDFDGVDQVSQQGMVAWGQQLLGLQQAGLRFMDELRLPWGIDGADLGDDCPPDWARWIPGLWFLWWLYCQLRGEEAPITVTATATATPRATITPSPTQTPTPTTPPTAAPGPTVTPTETSDPSFDPKALTVSQQGLEFIAAHEGMRLNLYNDPANHCTIGIGHLVHYGECDGRASEAPFQNGVTAAQAYDLLRQDSQYAERGVQQHVAVPLTEYQFDALVSFTFNVGVPALAGSDLLQELNAGHYDAVPDELNRWIYARVDGEYVALPGLIRRRQAEGALFRDGEY